jgi:hypothetical protein
MTIIGLVALCALALSAFAASGASAGTTAFTCVKGGTGFTEEHCKTKGAPGEFGHVAITEKTTLALTSLTNPVLTGKLFGATVELAATGVECIECTAENKEVGGVMEVTGSGGYLTFTGVKVVGLETKCEARDTGKGEDVMTELLKFTTTSSAGATLEPVTGTILAEFDIVAKPGQSCSVAGTGLKVTGKAATTVSGATLTVNVTKASGELKLEGEPASMKGEATITAGKIGSGVHHPVALTPTTP